VLRLAATCLLLLAAGAALAVEQFGYRVVDRKPQPTDHYVQGLQIVDGHLYVSLGEYGKSRLLRYRFDDGALDAGIRLDPRLFAEGLTVVGDRVYQLTWKNRAALVYDREDLARRSWLHLPGEGWGLTYDGAQLIYSDGSNRLHFMDPQTGHISHSLRVTEAGSPLRGRLNELEWIDGRVWANLFMTERVVVIDPATGAVTASIDLSGLRPAETRRDVNAVLNGIAQNPADGAIWVTGKRWPWLYRIELVPAGAVEAESDDESR
jgi:glutamine cyclotransferase